MGAAHRKVLDARVAGALAEIPRHPRVEPLTLRRILTKKPSKPVVVQADASLLECLRLLGEHDVGALLVMDGVRMAGTFSTCDYANATAHASTSATLREVIVPCNVSASIEDSVQACLELIVENRLEHLPVRDGENVIALLSRGDIQEEMILYLERVFRECELDQQIVFLRGTYSC